MIRKPRADLSILLNDDPSTYYWIGFLMADGSIDFKDYRLKLQLAAKDLGHLLKFAEYIQFTAKPLPYYTASPRSDRINLLQYLVRINDRVTLPLIIKKYGFTKCKKSNPPKLADCIDNEHILPFLIGFIDGDGWIERTRPGNYRVAMELHASWLSNLNHFYSALCRLFIRKNMRPVLSRPTISRRGHSLFRIGDRRLIRQLKAYAIEAGLPFLSRKWELIGDDVFTPTNLEIADGKISQVNKLCAKHFNIKQIAARLKLSYRNVYYLLHQRPLGA